MTENLESRLRAADPARSVVDASVDHDLLEALMNDTATRTEDRPVPATRRRWAPALAAAALAAVVGVGGYAVMESPGDEAPHEAASITELALPAGDSMASCIAFDVEFLRNMPVAFSGTAVEVEDGSVLLAVGRWYRGGDTDQVRLVTQGEEMVALIGSVTFEEGERYLVTATDGVVNACGYSAVWSEDMAADFQRAFGQD